MKKVLKIIAVCVLLAYAVVATFAVRTSMVREAEEVEYWKTQYVAYSILYSAEKTELGELYIESSIKTLAGVYDIDEESLRDCIDIILE